jgi:ATP-dependent DNA ligase
MGNEFPEIVAALKRMPGEWVLDAELVVPDERGYPSFERTSCRAVHAPAKFDRHRGGRNAGGKQNAPDQAGA